MNCNNEIIKKEDESEIKFLERLLQAMFKNMAIQGVTIALKSKSGTTMFTSLGSAPHMKVLDEDEWNDFWG